MIKKRVRFWEEYIRTVQSKLDKSDDRIEILEKRLEDARTYNRQVVKERNHAEAELLRNGYSSEQIQNVLVGKEP